MTNLVNSVGTVATDVTGVAWMDREWSSQPLASDQTGWDWLSLHLSSGDKVMLFRLRQKGGGAYFAGNWISATGRSEPLAPESIALEPLGFTEIGARRLPIRWRVAVQHHGFAAETTAATVLATAAHLGMPVSTTHAITTSIMGVGCARRFSALNYALVEKILWTWVFTIPATGVIAYGMMRLMSAAGWAG